MRKPHEVHINVDSEIDLAQLSRGISLDIESIIKETAQNVVTAYVLIKTAKTLCSAIEHVVVTKVK